MSTKSESKPKKKVAAENAEAEKPKAKTSTAKKATKTPTAKPADSVVESVIVAKEVSTLDDVPIPAASGKAGILGGPKDRGVKPDDKLALPTGKHFTFERVHSLNPKSFYCAMRWDYKLPNKSPEEAKRWWANKKIQVTNPANGKSVIVRAVDFGPHENTGLTISLSPAALEALEIAIGDEVEIAFAEQKAPTGVVE
jgi:hypothetical protein